MCRVLKLAVKSDSRPDATVLTALWGFIRGRTSLPEFEQYVYDNDAGLQTIFTADSVLDLMGLNYSEVLVDGLRIDLRTAIEALPMPCDCPKLAPHQEVDIGTFSHLGESIAVMDYVDGVLGRMDLIREDEAFMGYWQSVKNGVRGVKEFFQEARIYRCPECQRHWLAVLNESNVSWYLVEIDQAFAASGNTQELRTRLGATFAVEYAPNAD